MTYFQYLEKNTIGFESYEDNWEGVWGHPSMHHWYARLSAGWLPGNVET